MNMDRGCQRDKRYYVVRVLPLPCAAIGCFLQKSMHTDELCNVIHSQQIINKERYKWLPHLELNNCKKSRMALGTLVTAMD
jgi:hypothetical protein